MNVYPKAVEHTKVKVLEDIDRYLELLDHYPLFEKY